MGRKEELIGKVKDLMQKPKQIRDIGIIAHIDHGKTTLSDNLLAGSGMISEELAGKQLYLDFDPQEQARGITINAANVSLIHNYKDKDYLLNIIDTPGHVDFGGDVIRAMRAVDGAIIVVDAVEGAMPQTETVLRQAMKERVKPILFINKVDRLIRELKLTPDEMQKQFIKIIKKVNRLISQNCPEEFKDDWKVKVDDGSVMFGSAFHKWALSFPHMKKLGMTFKDIIDAYDTEDSWKTLGRDATLHKIVLDMVTKHLPTPKEAQKYRIPHIWPGEDEEVEEVMSLCTPDGPLALMITKIIVDPHAGDVATGRLFSGTLKSGQNIYLCNRKANFRTQQVGVYMGPDRVKIDEIPPGNIVAVIGLKSARSGETACDPDNKIEPFEAIKEAEPVVTEAIEAKNTKDLPKLIEVLRDIEKQDPAVQVDIDEETGEHKLSGMGELHLEIWKHRITKDAGIDIQSSDPIVVYRESVGAKSQEVEGKSPNKHNKFYITVEPLEKDLREAIMEGDISQGKYKKKDWEQFTEYGMDKDEAKKVSYIHGPNVFLNMVKGEVHIGEVIELCHEAFEEAMNRGPMADEKCAGIKIKLHDTKLHEDAIHRGPAQVIPAVRSAMKGAILVGKPYLLEPKQKVFIRVPQEHMGSANKELQSRRGQILDMQQEGDQIEIEAKAPVADMFGFASAIRSATEGRVLWSTENAGYEKLPKEIERKIIKEIRQRKGLKEQMPTPATYLE
ncbi:MAG: elongation factor EF-2 [Candidatus Undinarchaeales archaeon]